MAILKVINRCGKYSDDRALYNVVNYIRKECKARSRFVGGWAVYLPNAVEEMMIYARLINKESGTRLRHFMISFSKDRLDSPETLFEIAKECAEYYGAEYQIVFAVHEDRDHLHAHFVMNTISYRTGLKYRGQKKDLYCFIRHAEGVFQKHKVNDNLMRVRNEDNDSEGIWRLRK